MGAGGVGGRKRKRRGLEFRVAPDQRGGVQKRIHVDHDLIYSHDDNDRLLALAVLHASDGRFGDRSCALKPLGDACLIGAVFMAVVLSTTTHMLPLGRKSSGMSRQAGPSPNPADPFHICNPRTVELVSDGVPK